MMTFACPSVWDGFLNGLTFAGCIDCVKPFSSNAHNSCLSSTILGRQIARSWRHFNEIAIANKNLQNRFLKTLCQFGDPDSNWTHKCRKGPYPVAL